MINLIKHHPKFDMMRGIAAFIVLLGHVVQIFVRRLFQSDDIIIHLSGTLPRHAVLVFFLLSGYLITASIIANISRNRKFDAVGYLSARVLRIYPPLIGAVLLVLCCWAIINGLNLPGKTHYGILTDTYIARDSFIFHANDILLALTMHNGMLQADGPLWSLYIEFTIYIMAMFVALSVTAKTLVTRAGWIGLSVILFVYGMKVNTDFAFYLFVWFAGSLIAIATSAGWHERLTLYGGILFVVSSIALIILGIINPELLSIQNKSSFTIYIVQVVFCFFYLYLMFISKIFDGTKSKLLITSGSYSYSLYIIHFPLLLLIYSFAQNWIGASLFRTLVVSGIAMVSVVLVSSAFSRYFENQRIFKPWIHSAFALINLHSIDSR